MNQLTETQKLYHGYVNVQKYMFKIVIPYFKLYDIYMQFICTM